MGAMVYTEAEIADMMAEVVVALTGAADVMSRNLPVLAEMLTPENLANGSLRGYDIPAKAPVFNPDGSPGALGQPGQINPVMTQEVMNRYKSGLDDLTSINDALTKPRGTATRSALDKVRMFGRIRRGGIPGMSLR